MLIPFANVVSAMTPSNRREADKQLAMAMDNASCGVGTVIKLGKALLEDEESRFYTQYIERCTP